MTILEFAKLCGTSTQTLRYYDRVGLLKPSWVDNWTGYRHYEKEQASDYVKIKNLQLADFSIAEIKALRKRSSKEICSAFDEKIAAEQERLAQILKIRESYREETMTIEAKINAIAAFLQDELTGEELQQHFPELDPNEILQWKNDFKAFHPEDYEPVQEWRGFASFREAADKLPELARDRDYALIAGTADGADKNALVQMLMNAAVNKIVPVDGPDQASHIHVILVEAPEGEAMLRLLRNR